MKQKWKVGILAATGTVGQRFIQLLENHPWFEVAELAASDRSAGKPYLQACQWKISGHVPEYVRNMKVKDCAPNLECDLVFSGLPSSMAGEVETTFAKAGYAVLSNSKNHRMDEDVPLLVPEINPEHLALLEIQQKNQNYQSGGYIITNPNCSTMALVLALAPLEAAFGIEKVNVVTMQALSGAGYPGVASLDIIDNVIPYIADEEEKIETEPRKILGKLKDGKVVFADFKISAQCHRVNVLDGHLEAVSIALKRRPSQEQFLDALKTYRSLPQQLELPSAPRFPVVHVEGADRPQPRFDREMENGMATVVGRVRPCSLFDFKLDLLGHNTIRGAAGAAILNAELLVTQQLLKTRSY
ncbi:MAG: aspartate-semialdehyde dehydrogenase [Acidobacteria bacterium]|nr:aspartate-semialdehyde dehydrogenase [Acidobacteriota bacterium]